MQQIDDLFILVSHEDQYFFFRCLWLIDIKSVRRISNDVIYLREKIFNHHILPS